MSSASIASCEHKPPCLCLTTALKMRRSSTRTQSLTNSQYKSERKYKAGRAKQTGAQLHALKYEFLGLEPFDGALWPLACALTQSGAGSAHVCAARVAVLGVRGAVSQAHDAAVIDKRILQRVTSPRDQLLSASAIFACKMRDLAREVAQQRDGRMAEGVPKRVCLVQPTAIDEPGTCAAGHALICAAEIQVSVAYSVASLVYEPLAHKCAKILNVAENSQLPGQINGLVLLQVNVSCGSQEG